jgi:3D (Asp-Asp-Asp) domain-containing protein
MIKKHLCAALILTLVTSNFIIGNEYIKASENYEQKISSQNELIEQYKLNQTELEQMIKEKDSNVKVLRDQLNKVTEEKESLEKKQTLGRGEPANPKMYFEVTAYTAGYESTQKRKGDKGYGITASGTTVKEGRTIACPPSLEFGTKLNIESVGLRICEDRGGAIKNGHLDLYMTSLDAAIAFGRKTLLVEILN